MRRNRRKHGSFFLWLGIVMFGIVILCITVCLYIFTIRGTNVLGNRIVPKETIIDLSGVQAGDNYLLLNKEKMANRIETNRYLKYISTQFSYDGILTIRVNERRGMGILQRNGYYYVIDGSGMVLENCGMTLPPDVRAPIINGLNLGTTKILTGEIVGVMDKEQLTSLSLVLSALDETNMMGRTASVEISNLDNIYIMTTERARVVLGRAENLILKLVVAKEILHQREDQENLTGASVDISNGEEAHYIPAVLPTITPTPTPTPTVEPTETPSRK